MVSGQPPPQTLPPVYTPPPPSPTPPPLSVPRPGSDGALGGLEKNTATLSKE